MGNTLAQWRCAIGTFLPKARDTTLDDEVPVKTNEDKHLAETMLPGPKIAASDEKVPLKLSKGNHLAETISSRPKCTTSDDKVPLKVNKGNHFAETMEPGRTMTFLTAHACALVLQLMAMAVFIVINGSNMATGVRCLETVLPKSRSSSGHQDQPTRITRLSMVVRKRLMRVSLVLLVLLVAGLVATLLMRSGIEPNPGPDTQANGKAKDPLQRGDRALLNLAHNVLDLEQAKQLAGIYLGIDKTQIENIVSDDFNNKSPGSKIAALLYRWKTKEDDVTAKQLYSYLTKIDLRVSQMEKAREILEIQVDRQPSEPCGSRNVMFISNDWRHDPLDIAIVNRMLIEDIHLVDETQTSFKLYCATKMDPDQIKRCRRDADSLGVTLCHFDDLNTRLPYMDVVVCHYPQTHDLLLDRSEYMKKNAKQFVFVHAVNDKKSLAEFTNELTQDDYVFCVSETMERAYRTEFKTARCSTVYIPGCPLQLISEENVLQEETNNDDSDSDSDLDPGFILKPLTYCSGLSTDPANDYKIKDVQSAIQNMTGILWTIVTSTDAANQKLKQNIEILDLSNPEGEVTTQCYSRATLTDVNGDISDTTCWLIPSADKRRISRLDVLFALGSGKPILTHENKDEIMKDIKKYMNITPEDNIELGRLTGELDNKALQKNARRLLAQYLLDTKSAESRKGFIETLLGAVPNPDETRWKITITNRNGGSQEAISDVTRYFQRVVYLKDRIKANKIKAEYKEEIEHVLQLQARNIVLSVQPGSCQLVVYCPNQKAKDALRRSKDQIARLVRRIIQEKHPETHANVHVEMEEVGFRTHVKPTAVISPTPTAAISPTPTAVISPTPAANAEEDSTEKLFPMLQSENLEIRCKIPGDGNCFFRAVEDQLERLGVKPMSHGELRLLAVTHLKKTPEKYKPWIDRDHYETWENYLTQMSLPGTWADNPVVAAMAEVLERPMQIYSATKQGPGYMHTIPCGGHEDAAPVLLGHVPELHYYSLTEGDESENIAKKVKSHGKVPAAQGELTGTYVAAVPPVSHQAPAKQDAQRQDQATGMSVATVPPVSRAQLEKRAEQPDLQRQEHSKADKPSPPENLGVFWQTSTTAIITWAKPFRSENSPVSEYVLEIREEDCQTPREILVEGLKYTAKNLKQDQKYIIKVAARNYDGLSSEFAVLSPAVCFKICRPKQPVNVTVEASPGYKIVQTTMGKTRPRRRKSYHWL